MTWRVALRRLGTLVAVAFHTRVSAPGALGPVLTPTKLAEGSVPPW